MAYIGVNDKARLIAGAYVGIDDVAHKVKKIYVGVKGKAELVWQPEDVGNYPTLKSGDTWYQSSFTRGQFTTIAIYDSFTPTAVTGVVESWAADVDGTGAIMCYVTGAAGDRTLIIAGNGSGKIYANQNASYMFSIAPPSGQSDSYKYSGDSKYFSNLTSIQGLTLLNTSKTKYMNNMFYVCRNLIKPDLSLFNTYKVTNMSRMFYMTNYMVGSLDLTGFNTKNVTNFSYMLSACGASSAEALYGEWIINDTANVSNMFSTGDSKYLQEVTLIGAPEEPDTPDPDEPDPPVTPDPEEPEEPDTPTSNKKCTLAPGSTWYRSSVSCNTIHKLRFAIGYTPTGEEDESWSADEQSAGYVKCYRIGDELILSSTNMGSSIYANPNSSRMFSPGSVTETVQDAFCNLHTITGWKYFDTSQVVDMSNMFAFCRSLTSIDASRFDLRKVTDMACMFLDCDALTTVDMYGADLGCLVYMDGMFMGCNNLKSVSLRYFDTKNVVNMACMFMNCVQLEIVYVNGGYWDTSGANTTNMFAVGTPISKVTIIW